jgi:hypothetical protein
MLRTNLATRPFYNQRGVQLALAAAALLVVALTIFNVVTVISLSRKNTELATSINHDRDEAARLTREAQTIRAGLNQAELRVLAAAATEANSLIDMRTFSWTELFNRIEATIPADVMLSAIQPSFENNQIVLTMTVLARRAEDVDLFIDELEDTGHFFNVLPINDTTTEDGLQKVVMRGVYAPTSAAPEAPAPAQPATPSAGRGARPAQKGASQ